MNEQTSPSGGGDAASVAGRNEQTGATLSSSIAIDPKLAGTQDTGLGMDVTKLF